MNPVLIPHIDLAAASSMAGAHDLEAVTLKGSKIGAASPDHMSKV